MGRDGMTVLWDLRARGRAASRRALRAGCGTAEPPERGLARDRVHGYRGQNSRVKGRIRLQTKDNLL